jgi:cytochrome c553
VPEVTIVAQQARYRTSLRISPAVGLRWRRRLACRGRPRLILSSFILLDTLWGCTMFELLAVAMLIIFATLFAWLSLRAWRARNGFIKWGGTGLAALLSAGVTSVSAIVVVGLFEIHARSAPALDLKVAGTPEQIERGRTISDGFCSACHSKTGTLTGGRNIGEDFPIPVGSFVSSNLTSAGQLSRWSDGDIFRAIRNSIDRDGHWLVIMSYTNASKLSDDDTMAVIAYIRSLPAAGTQTANPPDHVNLLGVMMLGGACFRRASRSPPVSLQHHRSVRLCNMANISCRIRIAALATATS